MRIFMDPSIRLVLLREGKGLSQGSTLSEAKGRGKGMKSSGGGGAAGRMGNNIWNVKK